MNQAIPVSAQTTADWPAGLHRVLKEAGVRHASYVPDAGHAELIRRFHADDDVQTVMLSTEEEGVALACGAWLGGLRSVVLMQSSGVGNCINMLSLPEQARMPLLMLVTMRGEWGEFNPWQVPMSRATQTVLEAMGVTVLRAETAGDVVETVAQAAQMAYGGDQRIAVLLGQRLLGAKKW
ncbi:thiamine pyrophosphate-binding protein [Albimonas sp. CAU 1670]|uniref:thiamine pyrophosphate-binding protein n=1 Tax=Albimonas sp. CAU 1670 TaxID=3032599 RepID=UPI0023D9B466|nr:thiamine pyrophosphate-binding protein [Albimonas sp. CAU 1670]MDF2231469.1 thiamine pyrophosphate-binding protein [Albimonas sp. CAU 1670]